ncbi:hypothetical protein HDV01_003779 [Terramyces sp. JEL0728]|nr:hypothetical protein HDV01_003779 [Terramyces sp. JEL0728]
MRPWKWLYSYIANQKIKTPSSSYYPFWGKQFSIMVQFRSVVIDEAVKANVCPQLVVLGAGLDTRSWRLKSLSNTTVFEVDFPGTQEYKKSLVKDVPLECSKMVFVPVDFTKDKLESKLLENGFDTKKPTFWLLEGVLMYLELKDAKQLFSDVTNLSAKNSVFIATYMSKVNGKVPGSFFLEFLKEPVKSAFEPKEFAKFTQDFRWTTKLNGGAIDWKQEYAPSFELTPKGAGLIYNERVWCGSLE